MIMALAITITANIRFSELHLSHAQTLENIKDLSVNATDAHDPTIVLSRSNIYVMWVDFVTGNDDIYFKRTTDGGASFGNVINLSNNTGDSTNPDIASTNDGTAYIVWIENIKGKSKVFFSVLGE
jgi:hypothetical protein